MKNFDEKEAFEQARELQKYENRWVALVDDKVVASGESVEEVARKAEEAGYKRYAFFLVPSGKVRFAL